MKKLLEYATVQYWMETLKTKRNKAKCLEEFPKFLTYIKMTPDEIIEQRREDLKSDDNKIRRRWEHKVKTWYHSEYEKYQKDGKSTWTPFTTLTVVRSFFAHNDYALQFHRGELKQARSVIKEYVPTNEDLRAMYDTAETHRDKALLLVLSQSGLSQIDVSQLNIEDILPQLKEDLVYIEKIREKTGVKIQTCLGSECCEEIRLMLKVRNYPTEGALFVTHKGKRMNSRFINDAIKRIAETSEIGQNGQRFFTKNLRDYFRDCLERAKLGRNVIDRMMGWKASGARDDYAISKYTIVDAYKSAYLYISLNTYHKREDKLTRIVIDQGDMLAYQGKVIQGLTESINSSDPRKHLIEWRTKIENDQALQKVSNPDAWLRIQKSIDALKSKEGESA